MHSALRVCGWIEPSVAPCGDAARLGRVREWRRSLRRVCGLSRRPPAPRTPPAYAHRPPPPRSKLSSHCTAPDQPPAIHRMQAGRRRHITSRYYIMVIFNWPCHFFIMNENLFTISIQFLDYHLFDL